MNERNLREVVDNTRYESTDGFVMSREYGETPNGNQLNGKWVLRSPKGEFLDFDTYRHDLAERLEFNCFYL